mmetsp:Transcript_5854/g.36288  ORF Transcript_5854/g.36288 Transcript_5854/m.36288 type:complete len:397 (-) Transcript_5854:1860-3050(-)
MEWFRQKCTNGQDSNHGPLCLCQGREPQRTCVLLHGEGTCQQAGRSTRKWIHPFLVICILKQNPVRCTECLFLAQPATQPPTGIWPANEQMSIADSIPFRPPPPHGVGTDCRPCIPSGPGHARSCGAASRANLHDPLQALLTLDLFCSCKTRRPSQGDEVLPHAVVFCLKSLAQLRISGDDDVLVVSQHAVTGPIEAAIEQDFFIYDAEFVVHVRLSAFVDLHRYPRLFEHTDVASQRIHQLVVGDDAHLNASLLGPNELFRDLVARDGVNAYVEALLGRSQHLQQRHERRPGVCISAVLASTNGSLKVIPTRHLCVGKEQHRARAGGWCWTAAALSHAAIEADAHVHASRLDASWTERLHHTLGSTVGFGISHGNTFHAVDTRSPFIERNNKHTA